MEKDGGTYKYKGELGVNTMKWEFYDISWQKFLKFCREDSLISAPIRFIWYKEHKDVQEGEDEDLSSEEEVDRPLEDEEPEQSEEENEHVAEEENEHVVDGNDDNRDDVVQDVEDGGGDGRFKAVFEEGSMAEVDKEAYQNFEEKDEAKKEAEESEEEVVIEEDADYPNTPLASDEEWEQWDKAKEEGWEKKI
ncbi:pheromone-processing carboxypeptidase KEX1-like [Raphanus sativus]|nr:pheromone-processing carboxypeptidase KEX1-like [Raphanus sativus]